MFRAFLRTAVLFSFLVFSLSHCAVLVDPPSGPHNPSRAGSSPKEKEEENITIVHRTSPQREEVIAYAKKQLGARYKEGGKGPRSFDCSGFTSYVMKKFDVTLSPSSRYQAKEGKKVKVKDVQPGDLIFFKRSAAGPVFHVAMVVSNSREGIEVIHSTSRGVVIDNISRSSYWEPKIASARDVL
ncbi:MAG: C40 family peptidase [Phaeodactylibacter sp.]|nr:C40 family peptidase [Phaeodactylibacter sp.]MCB9266482.1 C40 family peptidase [Lewinellaceae bacterium]MCB9289084.1 C40 family peptidase [Lewinellaceae bacterium]